MGVYRSYYELVDMDPTYKNKVGVTIVADGMKPVSNDFKECMRKVGLYKETDLGNYFMRELRNKIRKLRCFDQSETMKSNEELYGTPNIGHCFTNTLSIEHWNQGLS
jgi:hypothetical protein